MEVNQLVAHYKANYEHKVFMTRLSHAMQNAYLMYIYDYPSELKNFADTFLAYLPFYIRNSTILRLSTKMRILIRNL